MNRPTAADVQAACAVIDVVRRAMADAPDQDLIDRIQGYADRSERIIASWLDAFTAEDA